MQGFGNAGFSTIGYFDVIHWCVFAFFVVPAVVSLPLLLLAFVGVLCGRLRVFGLD